ncbi:hypothetical protein AB0A95_13335 [Micromonospora sp. NPDC049230]|uniref:hypothetical protein n=1 Tax=Micromonospora sp. NPDC049230 TaxID=3155502 RepID=UPI0033DA5A53
MRSGRDGGVQVVVVRRGLEALDEQSAEIPQEHALVTAAIWLSYCCRGAAACGGDHLVEQFRVRALFVPSALGEQENGKEVR